MSDYAFLLKQIPEIMEGESLYIPTLANVSSLLYHSLANVNWVGFYLLHKGELVLGPFMGKPACVRIKMGRGVCGAAAQAGETLVVPNVFDFPGHIACDSASLSEMVIPLFRNGKVVGVLDIDSPLLNRFTEIDKSGLEAAMKWLQENIDWTGFTLG